MKKLLGYTKKPWVISLLVMSTFYIVFGFIGTDVAEASLRSKVTAGNGDELMNTIDSAGSYFVNIARQAAVVVCVIIAIWMGYSLWVKKTVEGIADVKGRLLTLVLGLACVFFAEKIIGTALKMLGYDGAI